MTTVLVCGGRDYQDRQGVFVTLDTLYRYVGIDLIIEGGARGADGFSRDWALSRGVNCRTFLAQWQTYGRRAGAIRNAEMLRLGKPDLVVAFPGGSGTADMVRKAKAAGVHVWQPCAAPPFEEWPELFADPPLDNPNPQTT